MVILICSVGFLILNLYLLFELILWVLGILMFIGVVFVFIGGGIRIIIFVILFLLVISKVFGRLNVRVFKC